MTYILLILGLTVFVCIALFVALIKLERSRNDFYAKCIQADLDLSASQNTIQKQIREIKEIKEYNERLENVIVDMEKRTICIEDTLPERKPNTSNKKYKHNCWMKLSNEGINYLTFTDNKVLLKIYNNLE